MSRREKKNKINLKIWVPIICMIIVGITFYMIHDIQNKIEKIDDQNITNPEENAVANEVEEENNQPENIAQEETNNAIENTNTNSSSSTNTNINQNSAPAQAGVTDQKQKAIELVKKEWGKDDTVNFVFDHVGENGEYVVAVKDRASATVKYYFRVNLETEQVELD